MCTRCLPRRLRARGTTIRRPSAAVYILLTSTQLTGRASTHSGVCDGSPSGSAATTWLQISRGAGVATSSMGSGPGAEADTLSLVPGKAHAVITALCGLAPACRRSEAAHTFVSDSVGRRTPLASMERGSLGIQTAARSTTSQPLEKFLRLGDPTPVPGRQDRVDAAKRRREGSCR
jgi:hypothetical protein